MIKKIICLILLYLCISCSNNTNSNIDKNKNLLNDPETLYKLAKINFDEQNFELARKQFSKKLTNYFHYLMKQFNQK